MPDSDETIPGGHTPANLAHVQEVIRLMGQIVNNAKLYGPDHKVTQQSLETGYKFLTGVLATCQAISLTISDGILLTDGRPIDTKNPLVAAFAKQLISLDSAGFSLLEGMTFEDYVHLMQLLGIHPDKLKAMGKFGDVLAQSNIQGIQARKVSYQRVTEEEVVVSKGKLEEALGGGSGEGSGDGLGIEQIIAFLKGETDGNEEQVAGQLRAMASDAHQLADLILKAADVREGSEFQGGETLGNIVVGCLRRAYDDLLKDPSVRTQQGKKELIKTLMLLQEDMIEKLRAAGGENAEGAIESIQTAVDEMVADLKVDSLAAEYMKKRKGIENTETRILKFLKAHEDKQDSEVFIDELKERLIDGGLSPEGWRELIVKSAGGEDEGGGASLPGAAELTALLQRLDSTLHEGAGGTGGTGETGSGGGMSGLIAEISENLDQVTAAAEQRLQTIDRAAAALEAIPDKPKADDVQRIREARQQIFAALAELGQEFCQPLSVINSSIEMIKMGLLGPVTDPQKEMLDLAFTSGERLKHLADKLLSITGVPETATPDAGILGDIYDGKPPQQF